MLRRTSGHALSGPIEIETAHYEALKAGSEPS
jgi:hypothetical protein